jgi:hypothetical protein
VADDSRSSDLELLAVTLVDMRATVDSMKRAITHAQSSVEQFRHTKGKDSLADIADCLVELRNEEAAVAEAIAEVEKPLHPLRNEP